MENHQRFPAKKMPISKKDAMGILTTSMAAAGCVIAAAAQADIKETKQSQENLTASVIAVPTEDQKRDFAARLRDSTYEKDLGLAGGATGAALTGVVALSARKKVRKNEEPKNEEMRR